MEIKLRNRVKQIRLDEIMMISRRQDLARQTKNNKDLIDAFRNHHLSSEIIKI